MPYASNDDLPASVRDHLPPPPRLVVRAPSETASTEDEGDPRQEEAAFRFPWGAVKKRYRKAGSTWVPKEMF